VGIEKLDQFGEVGKRSRQTVYLVDDDNVDLAGTDVVQQPLEIAEFIAVSLRATGDAAVVARLRSECVEMCRAFPVPGNRAVAQSGPIDELSRPQGRQAVIGPINREVERLNLGALNFHLLASFPQFAVKASNIATLQGRCRKPDHCRGRVHCRSTSCALRQSTLVLLLAHMYGPAARCKPKVTIWR
jgi:hypothetical protein